MHLFVAALCHLFLAALPRTTLVTMPTDVSGFAMGASAASFDAAAAGRLDGAELQLRQQGVPRTQGAGAWGAYGAVPLGPLSLHAGYAWRPLPNPTSTRGTFGASLGLGAALRIGASMHRLQLPGHTTTHTLWDVGLAGQPSRFVSWSLGGDALNAPAYPGLVHVNRALRVGFAVRPWSGDRRLTLAGDTRIQQVATGWQASDTRALVMARLYDGLQVFGGYARRNGAHEAFAGVGLDVWHTALQAQAQANGAGDVQGIDRWGFMATLKQHPADDVMRPQHRRVVVPIEGHLNAAPQGLWRPGKAISTTALTLHTLARDASVDTVVLEVGAIDVGLGHVAEVRGGIKALRAAGKTVIAELHEADNKTFMVAAAATRIEMDPLGYVNLKGFAVASHFFAEALAKVGVRFEAIGVGRYKSAPDALTQDGPRPQDQEVYDAILQEAYRGLVQSLVEDRRLSEADCNTVLGDGLLGAEAALRLGLIDAISPKAEAAFDDNDKPASEPVHSFMRPSGLWGAPDVIAIVPVIGAIVAHASDNPMPSTAAEAGRVTALLEAAMQDPHVKGIVVRIDSPGGDVFASESLWRVMHRAAEQKPLAVSMGDVAASGGYYMAAPARRIFAEPSSLTGSIGIFVVKPDISGLLAWAGVHRTVYAAGAHADWESVAHSLAPADAQRLQARLQSLYDVFVARVAEGRHMPPAHVRTLAEGRVYTGAQALRLGLVDSIGGLADAVAWVHDAARLPADAWVEVHLPDRTVSLPQLLLGAASHASAWAVRTQAAVSLAESPYDAATFATDVVHALQRRVDRLDGRPLALLPYALEIKTP